MLIVDLSMYLIKAEALIYDLTLQSLQSKCDRGGSTEREDKVFVVYKMQFDRFSDLSPLGMRPLTADDLR